MEQITKVEKLVKIEATLPDGLYSGLWGGYEIKILYNNEEYVLTTLIGVKGMNYPVIVTVKEGVITFEDKNLSKWKN